MRKKLLIIGAGNIGGFIAYNISDFGDYEIVGFLDDDPNKIGSIIYGHKVLGSISSIDDYLADTTMAVVIGIGNPGAKENIRKQLQNSKLIFPNFISNRVWLSQKVEIGIGIIIYPGVTINFETIINDFVIVNMNCSIGHNCTLGAYSTLAPGVQLAGFSDVGMGADVGIGASTIQRVKIGVGAVVGGMSMVIRDVPENAVVVGNPARILRVKK